MKKIIVSYFLCFCLYNANGQSSNDIIAKIDYIDSEILNEERKVLIYVPKDTPEKTYPVIYLLDGDAHFHSVVAIMRQLSPIHRNVILPEMMIVGISNTKRTRDLTPTKGELPGSGGGANFISFVEKELIPHINATYPTKPYRVFIGHSLGGLTVMNTLIHTPNLFNAYVAIDPSMHWNKKKLLHQIKNTTLDKKYANKTLFLGIANTMRKDMDTVSVQKDTTASTKHIRAILELNSYLRKDTQKYLSFKGKYYADDDHGSIPFIATYDALRYIFDFYKFKLTNEAYSNPEIDILGKIQNYYKRLSKGFGIEMKPDQRYINELGYTLLEYEQFEKAAQVFKLNVKNYPENFSVYDSMGDFYIAIGNKEKAIENYKKSVSLYVDSYSKYKLIELEKE
ncbi:alpha/beta hydrolase-fold protein [Kordia sp.]|uniref:alpha/beta hydrolase-fold protein n=1 Tax=Kordia sp. TaxID=1965332 RepID=UPI003D2A6568